MKQLTEQQIVDNWNKLMQLIEDTFGILWDIIVLIGIS